MPGTGRCPASGRRAVPRPSRDGVDRGLGMRTFFEAATGFPTFLFTVPLLAAAGFWLLVAVGAADSRTFDGDADLGALGLGGVPVAVAFSLWTGFAWAGSLGAAVLLEPLASSGPARALTGLAVLVAAPSVSWCATRALVLLLRRLHPPVRRSLSAARRCGSCPGPVCPYCCSAPSVSRSPERFG